MNRRIYFSADKRAVRGDDGRTRLFRKCPYLFEQSAGPSGESCAKVEAVAGLRRAVFPGRSSLREQFERDPMVRSMLQRFGGKISGSKMAPRGVLMEVNAIQQILSRLRQVQ